MNSPVYTESNQFQSFDQTDKQLRAPINTTSEASLFAACGLMKAIMATLKAKRAQGPATIMALATANPPNRVEQSAYADQYFHVTNSDHMQELKHKFHRMCVKSMIKTRNMYLTEEILKERPRMCGYNQRSFDDRQDIVVAEVPKLAMEAASKAIEEWGRPKSDVTHLVFASTSGVDMPGADYRLVHLLGLPLTVQRIMIYSQACHMGAAMLRVAKDIAQNDKNARVLVVSCEMTSVLTFRGPDEADFGSLVAQVTFADGAAALIVGADPVPGVERPIFKIIYSAQETVPGTGNDLGGQFKELGLTFHFNQLPVIISSNIQRCLSNAFGPLDISDWNDVFWVAHPGMWSIMDAVEAKLGLAPEKLRASRHVFSEHGNMLSATVLFVMDRVRKQSAAEGRATTGDGLEWGVCFGFGPGFSIETVVLRSVPI